jgi:hypothetical protein
MSILGYGGIPDGDDTECSSESANGDGDGDTRAVFWSRQEGVYFSYKYRQVQFLPPFIWTGLKNQKTLMLFETKNLLRYTPKQSPVLAAFLWTGLKKPKNADAFLN